MKNFLRKLKLSDNLTIDLNISKSEFVNKLLLITDQEKPRAYFNPFDAFKSSQKEYIGEVTYNGFNLRKRGKIFDPSINFSIATGTYDERNESLLLETEIVAFKRNNFILFMIILFIIGYCVAIFQLALNKNWIFIPLLIVHCGIMIGFPYLMMRRSIKRMKYDLEREFYYFTKK